KLGRTIKRLNASAFARLVSGHTAKDGTGSLPLLPRSEQSRYHGYSAHSYRHFCYQAMQRAGARARRDQDHSYSEYSTSDFARAVVGHDLIRGVGDVYRDIARQQQHLSRIAIGYAWREIRHQPSNFVPDPGAIEEACAMVELLAVALDEFRRD